MRATCALACHCYTLKADQSYQVHQAEVLLDDRRESVDVLHRSVRLLVGIDTEKPLRRGEQ